MGSGGGKMIGIRRSLKKGIGEMLVEVVEEISKKYSLDSEEVKKYIGVEVSMKKEKGKRVILPFCGRIDEEKCRGIKINYGLYTQCEKNIFSNNLCKCCNKQSEKNSNGKPNYGTIDERLNKNYKDKNGKEPVKYSKIMEKMNITREMAEKEAEEQGLIIPEEEFEIKKTNRGRPKKSVSTTDTSDEESIAEPKKRGRPPKEKKVIENGNIGDDLIKNLIEEAKKNEEKVETKKELEPEIINNNDEDDEPKDEEDDEPKDEEDDEPKNEEDDESDEEETVVVPFVFKGVKYLKAADNTIYDINTHEEIGIWDEIKQEIVEDEE